MSPQLSGLTITDLIKNCRDDNYSNFLKFVKERESYCNFPISNIGTILDRVSKYSVYEQLFSSGLRDINPLSNHLISSIPKGLIKLCRQYDLQLSDTLIDNYLESPDNFYCVFNKNYETLTNRDLFCILKGQYYDVNIRHHKSMFNYLINEYGYTAKSLINYIDYCKTFEAIDDTGWLLYEIQDYAKMMKEISPKFDKYPRHFLTTHKIACRNYNRLKAQFDEAAFEQCVNADMEHTFGDYVFIYPKSTQEIKDEAVSMNNCVASYIDRVINRQCDILFLRKKDEQDKSLVTIEVRNNQIVQARQRFNDSVTEAQQTAIDKWNKWYANNQKIKRGDTIC